MGNKHRNTNCGQDFSDNSSDSGASSGIRVAVTNAGRCRSRIFLQTLVLVAGCSALLAITAGYSIATAAAASTQAPAVVSSIDHVEFFVSDLPRALTFYRRLFGAEIWKNRQTERRYLPLGTAYLALEQRDAARIDHVCFGIADFDISRVHAYLDEQKLVWQDYPSGRDLRVDDRDGTRVQLAQNPTWPALAQNTASLEPQSVVVEPLLHPLGLDEIYITVTDLEVDSLHYARLLGESGSLQAGSLWFDLGSGRLRLSQAPPGQSPGVNYFSVLISNTDLEAAADAVFAAGGIIENILPNGFSFWDPDGLRVEVHVASQL
jgi:catechol 2,3-dioxygenase-like lactoylglutathione lyase family enzyme